MQEAEKKITLKKEGSWVRETYLKKKFFMVSLNSSMNQIFVLQGFRLFVCFFIQDKNEFEETLC